uniref:Uncharacterized protein n=1 Tax=Arundo donax TaxID=35708 RepID=A0A0A9BRF3_ARUDO
MHRNQCFLDMYLITFCKTLMWTESYKLRGIYFPNRRFLEWSLNLA